MHSPYLAAALAFLMHSPYLAAALAFLGCLALAGGMLALGRSRAQQRTDRRLTAPTRPAARRGTRRRHWLPAGYTPGGRRQLRRQGIDPDDVNQPDTAPDRDRPDATGMMPVVRIGTHPDGRPAVIRFPIPATTPAATHSRSTP